jgi:hypothetical protein
LVLLSISHLRSSISYTLDRLDLGVGLTGCVMEPSGENLAVLYDHGADSGIGGCLAKRPGTFLDRQTHETFVDLFAPLGCAA